MTVYQCRQRSVTMNSSTYALIILSVLGACQSGDPFFMRLTFNKGSRIFVRLNTRENLLWDSQTFLHAVGYKMAWDLPDKVSRDTRMERRDFYVGLEYLLQQPGLNGRTCLTKFFCESALKLKHNTDFTSRLLKLIFTPEANASRDGYGTAGRSCRRAMNECPLSLLSFTHG